MRPRPRNALPLLALLLLAPACRSTGDYVWVDALSQPVSRAEPEYVIGPGDLLNVRVYNQDGMSGKVRVRADGRISLPFVNDVDAAGVSPAVLARRLEVRFKDFIHNPVVTVAVEEQRPVQISVVGEVAKPGVYKLEPGTSGVLYALATAGGLTPFAAKNRIFVLRRISPTGPVQRIRFTYEALEHAEGRAATFRMQDADVLVVE